MNGQFVIMTDYVFSKFDFIHIPVLSRYNNSPNTRSGIAGVNLNTAAVDIDIVAS